ncbi:STY1053 family phage-associated protein [Ralstonia pseudosolanacearum]|uniref:STY1053 family phage-associated protein n=1 Tax=Ralstonia pseudosolanacearum TaxID=1310165 RepID=UPI003EDEE33B
MPKIHVHKPFTLTNDDGTQTSFAVGEHDVEAHVANHWYVKAHAGEKTEVGGAGGDNEQPDDDAGAELAEQRKILESAAAMLEGRAEQLAKMQDDVADRETAVAKREGELSEREEALRARETELDAREDAIAAREASIAAAAAEQANGDQAKGQQQGQKKQQSK